MLMLRKKSFFILLLIAFSASPFACQSKQAVKELPEIKEHERQVKLDGQANFRDLGGYSTTDGRSVKWGLIYRAGQLNELSDADLSKLKELDIRTVIDLRGTSEAESRGKDRLPDGVRNMSYPIDVMSLPKEEENVTKAQ